MRCVNEHDSVPPSNEWGDGPDSDTPTTRRASVGAIPGGDFRSHGARVLSDGSGTIFRVFAPTREAIDLVLYAPGEPAHTSQPPASPKEARRVRLSKGGDG